jgi:hypothetical protein
VVVRGPWAYAETATNLILIAPVDNDNGHYPPSVFNLGGEVVLGSGKLYKMDFVSQTHPAGPQPCGTSPDGYGYLVGFDIKKFNRLQTSPPSNIYIMSLPLPDSCTATQQFVSDIGTSYFSSVVNKQLYATDMTFTYTVSDRDKRFTLGGASPYPIEGGNMIDIMMEPSGQITDYCNLDSRHAFYILVQALGLKLFEDFEEPGPPPHYRDQDCKPLDPQNDGRSEASRAMRTLSLLLRHYSYYLQYPSSEAKHHVSEDFDAYEDAARELC